MDSAVRQGVGEGVDADRQPDERLDRIRPPAAHPVEALDGGLPVLSVGVDAAEERAVLQDRVDSEHASVDGDVAWPAVDAEQAGDAVAAKQGDGVDL